MQHLNNRNSLNAETNSVKPRADSYRIQVKKTQLFSIIGFKLITAIARHNAIRETTVNVSVLAQRVWIKNENKSSTKLKKNV